MFSFGSNPVVQGIMSFKSAAICLCLLVANVIFLHVMNGRNEAHYQEYLDNQPKVSATEQTNGSRETECAKRLRPLIDETHKSELKNAQSDLESAESELKSTKSELESAQSIIDETQSELKSVKTELQSMTVHKELLDTSHQERLDTIITVSAKLKVKENRIRDLETELAKERQEKGLRLAYKTEVDETTDLWIKFHNRENQIKSLEAELETSKASHQEELRAKEVRITLLDDFIKTSKASHDSRRGWDVPSNARISALESKLKQAEDELDRLYYPGHTRRCHDRGCMNILVKGEKCDHKKPASIDSIGSLY